MAGVVQTNSPWTASLVPTKAALLLLLAQPRPGYLLYSSRRQGRVGTGRVGSEHGPGQATPLPSPLGHWALTASLPVSRDTICFSDPTDLLCIFNKPRSMLSPKVDGNLFST